MTEQNEFFCGMTLETGECGDLAEMEAVLKNGKPGEWLHICFECLDRQKAAGTLADVRGVDGRRIPEMSDVPAVAVEFSKVLNEWLSKQEMETVRRVNAEDPDSHACASHDFCDANMAMSEAFDNLKLVRPFGDAYPVCFDVWNRAWDAAKAARFDPVLIAKVASVELGLIRNTMPRLFEHLCELIAETETDEKGARA